MDATWCDAMVWVEWTAVEGGTFLLFWSVRWTHGSNALTASCLKDIVFPALLIWAFFCLEVTANRTVRFRDLPNGFHALHGWHDLLGSLEGTVTLKHESPMNQ